MPYTEDSENLPDNVKKMSPKKRKRWIGAWNGAYEQCQVKGGDNCEAHAFAIANAAVKEMSSGFLYADLALSDGRPFDGLVAGTFTDMHGKQVTFTPEILAEYVANTQAAIESARSESGEVVGLPIDARDHDKGDGAGWIVSAGITDGKVKLTPKWTQVGIDLIGGGIRRFFSATVDTVNKVILGGTLTNWPAVRSSDGKMLLRPVELSEQLYFVEKKPMVDETITETPAPVIKTEAVTVTPNFAELMSTNVDLAAQMREFIQAQVEARMKNAMAQLQRKSHITELCQRLTGGDSDHAWGLPIKEGDLSDVLLSLDDTSREKVEGLLTRIHEAGMVDFAERGHAKQQKGLAQLPDQIKRELHKATGAGMSIAEFFTLNQADLGSMSDYDLSEFQAKEK